MKTKWRIVKWNYENSLAFQMIISREKSDDKLPKAEDIIRVFGKKIILEIESGETEGEIDS